LAAAQAVPHTSFSRKNGAETILHKNHPATTGWFLFVIYPVREKPLQGGSERSLTGFIPVTCEWRISIQLKQEAQPPVGPPRRRGWLILDIKQDSSYRGDGVDCFFVSKGVLLKKKNGKGCRIKDSDKNSLPFETKT